MFVVVRPHARRQHVQQFALYPLWRFPTHCVPHLANLAGNAALPLEFSVDWLARVFGQPWIYGAFVGYIGAFFSWMTLLKRAPIGPAFAASHLEILSVLALSYISAHEIISSY